MIDSIKICTSCHKDNTQVSFRKRRAKCIDCINITRRAGHKRKMIIENALLDGTIIESDCRDEYKRLWHIDNKEKIDKRAKINYLKNRENRLKNDNNKYYDSNNFASILFRSSSARSKKHGIEFDLDIDFIKYLFDIQDNKCSMTDIPFKFEKDDKYVRRPFAPSIDRINNNFGYTKNNVRLVCVVVNISLNEFGDEVFYKMCKAYLDKINSCNQ